MAVANDQRAERLPPRQPLEPGGAHKPRDPALPAGDVLATEGLVDPRRPVGALGLFVDADDLLSDGGAGRGPRRRDAAATLAGGGTGDLKQAARALDAVTWLFPPR
jgi:hypothetical protein